jgi:DNA (cytosine-5)-methyltransferase 1
MNYLSVCSGIEAATVAWHDMGWNPVGFSEIEKFPSQLLAHHYPNVTNYGDMTKFKEWNINESVNLLVGGTPCQSFSVAGLRKGLEDPRGNLMLTYLAMADHFKPKWLLWENVPGVLSSNRGHDFAALLQGLAQLGYGFAYRVLDAQHFGVPQRRRRVFVVGCLGDWRSAAKVLFESKSLCRDITPSRSEGQETTGTLTRGFGDRGYDLDQIAGGGYKIDAFREADLHNYKETKIAGTSKASGGVLGGGSETFLTQAYNITFCDANGTRKDRPDGGLYVNETDTSNTLTRAGVGTNALHNMRVRRLTPIECERLQGFPDNYTNTPTSSDSTRYKALGNSMAVPVMKWIGNKIMEINK